MMEAGNHAPETTATEQCEVHLGAAIQAKGLTRGVNRCYGTPVPHPALLTLMVCNVPAMLFCGYLLLRALVRQHRPHSDEHSMRASTLAW
jgi:hypothetical protein